MNKNRYRIIFSKAKNMFIAVAENIKSQSKATGQSTYSTPIAESVNTQDSKSFHQLWQVKSIVASMSLFMAFSPVYAQMQADPNAAASQRASIGVGKNQQGQNVPVVNIQTPKNGVSHNVYNQFDVLQPGVVLNNSRNGAGSVIVGQVGANPYLQTGEARVILNEVNSSAASQFRGNLEIAGQRADVIIANPSGINIQGGGFINANKAIFTTGKPQLNADGSIKQFVVNQGKVNVNSTANNLGLGGNNNNADYVDIYAKAVELNAQVHANQALQVITGSNTISEDLTSITPNQANSTTPTFALDVKALGGMYANNIFIIGTDKGLGVSNAGTIQSPQSLVITSAGKIENTGTMKNTNPQGSLLSISTGDGADIVSSGAMLSNGNLFLESGQNITLDRARLEKLGTENPNIISVKAKGDVNLLNSTNVQNFSESENLYIDASNINLGNDINLGVNGSIFLEAKQNLKADAVRNISATHDVNLTAGDLLTLKNTPVWANSGNINLATSKAGSNLSLTSTRLNAEKDVNIYGANSVSINNLGLDKVGQTTKTKNFNVNAQGNLTWQNAGTTLPTFTGKLDLRSNGKLDILGSQFIANEGINLLGKELLLNSQLKTNKDINLTASENNVNLNLGTNLSAGTDINVSALKGNINTKNLKAVSEAGKASFIAYGDTNLQSDSNSVSTQVNAKKGITIASIGTGDVNIKLAELSSTEGGVKVQSDKKIDINNTNINAKGNVEIFANHNLVFSGVNSNSNSHTAINGSRIFFNSSPDGLGVSPLFLDNSTSQFKSDGLLSVTSKDGSIFAQNLKLTGGATLIESGYFVDKKSVELNAIGSQLLRSDAKLNSLDGDLSLQIDNGLRIDPKSIKLNATGDIDLISKNGATTLVGYGGANGQGSEEVVNLTTANGGITLEGEFVILEGAKLNAKKDIKIVANRDQITINGIKNKVSNYVSTKHINDANAEKALLQESLRVIQADTDYKSLISKRDNVIPGSTVNSSLRSLNEIKERLEKKYPIKININMQVASSRTKKIKIEINNEIEQRVSDLDKLVTFLNAGVYGDEHVAAVLTSESGNINLTSARGVSISGSELASKTGLIDIEAQGLLYDPYKITTQQPNGKPQQINASIVIDGTVDLFEKGNPNDGRYTYASKVNPTILNASKGVNIRTTGKANGNNLVLQGTGITSQNGDVKIESFKNILFDAALEQSYDKSGSQQIKRSWLGLKKKYINTKTVSENIGAASVDIQAKNISIESKEINNPNNSIDIYSGKLDATGNISIRSGGNINFYTVNRSSSTISDITKESSFAGIKYNDSKTNSSRSQISQIPVTLTADYIGVKSGFDTRLVGTEFNYLSGAQIESGGKTFIDPAITKIEDIVQKQKKSIVWQSMQDKGSVTETGTLPSFNGPTPPVFKADGGITVQIPVGERDQNKVQIRDEILRLANQPGNQYLKDFVNRNDVDWNKIILAQKGWDYKSQGLTGAAAAIIVIIVAIVTYGAGTAVAAGTAAGGTAAGGTTVGLGASMIGTAGITTTTTAGVTTIGVSTLGTMANAAVASIATQTSISLINNGGDVAATFKELGSKEYIKSLATSVVTAGVIDKLGGTNLMSQLKGTGITDRVATNLINSTASALVNSGINGGSLSDNLQTALLTGFADAIQGFTAENISGLQKGTNLDIDYIVHKVAHAAAGCVAGAIQKDCEAGALGASLGEIFAQAITGDKFTYTDQELIKIKNISKVFAASVAAAGGYDVNIAANSAENALTNNWLGTQQKFQKDLEYAKANSLGDVAVYVKYGSLDSVQDKLTKAGFAAGVVYSAGSDAKGVVEAILSPVDTFNGLKSIITDPEVRAQLSDSAFASLNTKMQRIDNNLKTGGLSQASQVGYDLGTLTWEAAGLLVLVKGAATATAKLGTVGVKITQTTATAAKNAATYNMPVLTGMSAVQSKKIIKAIQVPTLFRKFNDVVLDPKLPDPVAGYDYKPPVLTNGTSKNQYSQVNGYKTELYLANDVANLPNQVVLKYGAKGHGSDIISVDVSNGSVYLWDAKYRSGKVNLKEASTTFTSPSAFANVKKEALDYIQKSNLSSDVKILALNNINSGTFTTYTVAAGNVKNSVIYRCVKGVCN
ncbi:MULTISPECIES: DUF637 domain-containing protein [Acinetobacter]|uniref:two-partner secretion domain-containing protein n=1 Tax=Acinetobacter TaxID=469 RepID=UPI000CFE8303|nr:DUF637 domain-containing protein [Acinetobacter sp. MYb10]QLD63488.1 DUF637 domain-containing protein [Acinetobacter sp. MYb10]